MRSNWTIDRGKDGRVPAWHETLTWTPLTERHPDPCVAVLVRMADGKVVGAHWDGRDWRHSPFDPWGEALAWAKLPALHRTP